MNSNVRIAKQLVRIARELVGAGQNKYPTFEIGKTYSGFTGRFQHPVNHKFAGWVMNAEFMVGKAGITWIKGVWKQGIWIDGVWKGGYWKSGIWEMGEWQNGTWEKGTWKDGTWKNGVWLGGTWVRGEWWKGYEDKERKLFHGAKNSPDQWAKFKSQDNLANKFGQEYSHFTGIVDYGTGDKGNSLHGEVEDASFIMDDFTRKNFTWHNGTWKNGRFEHGTWEDGTWLGGFFNSANSKWLGGKDKNGNYHGEGESPDGWMRKPVKYAVYETGRNGDNELFEIDSTNVASESAKIEAMESALDSHGINVPDDCDFYVDGKDIVVRDDDGNVRYRMKKKQ